MDAQHFGLFLKNVGNFTQNLLEVLQIFLEPFVKFVGNVFRNLFRKCLGNIFREFFFGNAWVLGLEFGKTSKQSTTTPNKLSHNAARFKVGGTTRPLPPGTLWRTAARFAQAYGPSSCTVVHGHPPPAVAPAAGGLGCIPWGCAPGLCVWCVWRGEGGHLRERVVGGVLGVREWKVRPRPSKTAPAHGRGAPPGGSPVRATYGATAPGHAGPGPQRWEGPPV